MWYDERMKLTLYNTLTRKKEAFAPLEGNEVRMYTCGPTVYDYPHIGNLRSYIFGDVLKRALLFNGYKVKHVMNITDVGHLTSDADEGEDKLEKGALQRKQTVWEVADFYTEIFKKNIQDLNILPPDFLVKATDHIQDQIELIKILEQKRFTYHTPEAIYFDVSKFPNYTKLSRQPLEEKKVGVRSEVHVDAQKKHPADFALWFLRVGRFANHTMHWASPWGEGFPGWHIECSAMAMKYLGEQLDIHTGGVDHIATHHTNEIAQSESATGKQFVRWWMHGEFLLVDGKKMSKSAGTFITLDDIIKRGFSPLAFRLLCLQSHYRSQLNFTWDSLAASQTALDSVYNSVKKLGIESGKQNSKSTTFKDMVNDDLSTAQALAIFFETLSQTNAQKIDALKGLTLLLKMDIVLGLGLKDLQKRESKLPQAILDLISQRQQARDKKDWEEADALRQKINKLGYNIEDEKI